MSDKLQMENGSDISISLADKSEFGKDFKTMNNPIVKFTLEEAQDHYKGNPTVKCLAEGKTMMLNSLSIHSVKYAEYPEPWIWGRNFSGINILLYGPSKFQSKCVKAEIINID